MPFCLKLLREIMHYTPSPASCGTFPLFAARAPPPPPSLRTKAPAAAAGENYSAKEEEEKEEEKRRLPVFTQWWKGFPQGSENEKNVNKPNLLLLSFSFLF